MKYTFSDLLKDIKFHYVAYAVIILTGIIVFGGEGFSQWLRYDRQAIEHGEYWRIISAHLTHLTISHWILNACGWLLVWFLYRAMLTPAQWIMLLLWSSMVVSLGLYVLNEEVFYYVGLSGSLHGLFIVGAMMEIHHGWRVGGGILMMAFTGKLIYEQIYGSLPGTTQMSGGWVIVDAHLYGALAGLFIGVFFWLRKPTKSASSVS